MKKKTYNPFKMCGSWLGVGVYSIWFLGWWIFADGLEGLWGLIPSIFLAETLDSYNFLNLNSFFLFGIIIILNIAFFFLLGWGIHSLIRRLKK